MSQNEALDEAHHANRHVAEFLALPKSALLLSPASETIVQLVEDGSALTAANLLNDHSVLTIQRPILVTDSPESIGMKLPRTKNGRDVTISDIARYVGSNMPVRVIDVKYQHELEGWTFGDLVDYFEDEDRTKGLRKSNDIEDVMKKRTSRPRRRAAQKCIEKTGPGVLNQISLEFSDTPLAHHVRSPKFSRELDWIDNVWPKRLKSENIYPNVKYYCLTSASGSYTDFHIDFGGTSVWYHVLSGRKDFCLIAPTEDNLKVYEEWLCSKSQTELFLPNQIRDSRSISRIHLNKGQTLFIPSGWIHAVYTPDDSLVFGGNFIHGIDIDMQLKVYSIEIRTKVLEQYRFPYFVPLYFYAGGYYLRKSRIVTIASQELKGLPVLVDALVGWWNVWKNQDVDDSALTVSTVKAARESALASNCDSVEELLSELHAAFGSRFSHISNADEKGSNNTASVRDRQQKPTLLTVSSKPRLKIKLAKADAFRIEIKSSSTLVEAIPFDVPVQRSTTRESIDKYVDRSEAIMDDEWKPDLSRSPKRLGKALSNGRVASAASKPKTTARQRLFKKTKW
jgi:hypothetical protein